MNPFDVDAVVVGAGAVGLGCTYALVRKGRSVIVLEKARAIGQGVSSRSSEVIHAGLYYPTGTLRATLCVKGRRMLYAFLQSHGVAHERCGKLVVATSPEEVPLVNAVERQAGINGVEGVSRLSGADARELEPELQCVEALLSLETGILDSHGYMLALQGEIEDAGSSVALGAPFEAARPLEGGGFQVRAGGAEAANLTCRTLIIASGLSAQACAAEVEGFPKARIPKLYYGKGSYFSLSGRAPFARLVYPPPIPGALGLHYKRDLAGRAHFGPDLEWVEEEDYAVDPGRAALFYHKVRRFWPGLADGALSPDYAGVRPKLHGKGEPQPDFDVVGPNSHGLEGLVALFGMESPGLTASLAIGEHVAGLASG
jgi:L-2-hydroxyglutarate oxidase LhgO